MTPPEGCIVSGCDATRGLHVFWLLFDIPIQKVAKDMYVVVYMVTDCNYKEPLVGTKHFSLGREPKKLTYK